MEIKFNNVSYKNILKNISVSIEENKITGIMGHSGAGKTTFAELLVGINMPTEGEIVVDKVKLSRKLNLKKINNFRRCIGYSYQYSDEQLFCKTVNDELILSLKNYNYSKEEIDYKKKEICEMFGFTNDFLNKDPYKISNGEKRLLVLACSIIHNPNIIILDEVTTGLDLDNKKKIISIIKKLKTEYLKTIIVISHDLDLLIKLVDNVIVMNQGEVILSGKKMDVFSNTNIFKKYNIEMPTIIKFSDIVKEKKNIKLGYYDDIKDLMKAVYRNV